MRLRIPLPTQSKREPGGIGGMDVGRTGLLIRGALPAPMLSAAKQGVRGVAMATSASRVLPDYLIVGTKKGGTTSLANWLVQHPGVMRMFPKSQRHKSAHYFDTNFTRSAAWYRSHFPTERARERRAQSLGYRPLVGEASPYYMFHPAVPDRVRSLLPEARVIMLLRDPVSRAYSQYWDRVSTGFETLPTFEEAIAAEAARLESVEDAKFTDPRYEHFSFEHHSYLARGRYAEQLARWYRVFDPSQVLILDFERLHSEPAAVLGSALDFLSLPSCDDIDLRARNERTNRPPMPASCRDWLGAYFRPHNRRLVEMIGREFSWTAG